MAQWHGVKAYADASRSIGSDYTRHQVLQSLVDSAQLSASSWRLLLQTAQNIGSDYELAQFLVSVAPRLPKQDDVWAAYDAAAKKIGSDYESGRVARARSRT